MTDITSLDLATINALSRIAEETVRQQVLKLEQWAADAQSQGMDGYAKQLTHACRELEFISHRITSAFTAVFIEEMDRQLGNLPVVTRHTEVALPEVPQRTRPYAKGKVVETTATTVD